MFLPFQVTSTDQISLLNRKNGTPPTSLDFFNKNRNSNFAAAKECPPIISHPQVQQGVYYPQIQGPPPIVLAKQTTNSSENLPLLIVGDKKSVSTLDGITVDERILSLSGIYQVLSHCYVTPIFIHRKRYRSVEHYVCQKFFKSLGFNAKAMEKLLTTTDPRKLPSIVAKILSTQYPPIPEQILVEKQNRMTEWYETAVGKKFECFPILRRILLATGDAFLIETNNLDDKIMSVGISEAELQHLMTKCDVNPEKLLQYMLQPKENSFYRFRKIGLNRTGVMLMKLRTQFRQSTDEPSVLSLFDRIPTVSPLDYETESVACFTCDSVLHPKYLSPIWDDNSHIIYPSVDHYVYSEGAKFLCFPQSAIERILDSSSDDVRYNFYEEIWNRFPDPAKYFEWWSIFYDDALKNACRIKFEKHPELMRLLLETTDSLLFYCHRFMTLNGDWSTGMRESELREWKTHNHLSNASIIDMMLDSTKRPPFLGGNRLGFILMELRREFRLKGYQSHVLPVLTTCTNKEVLFGESIGLETGDEFDCNTTPSKYLLWPSPMVLQLKERNVAVWYPGKRRLTGYYDEGYSPELKRPTDLRDVLIHPEYSLPVPFGKMYSMSPDIMNITNAMDPLKSMVVILVKGVMQLNMDISQQSERLCLMLNEIYERNGLEMEESSNVESKPRFEHNNATVSATALRPSVTGSFHLSPKHPALLAKIRSLEDGFLSSTIAGAPHDHKQTTDDRLNFDAWDDKRIMVVIQQLYSHLNATERMNALEWFKLTVNKLKTVNSPSAMVYSDNSLRTFVPLTKRKTNFVVPHFFKTDDCSF